MTRRDQKTFTDEPVSMFSDFEQLFGYEDPRIGRSIDRSRPASQDLAIFGTFFAPLPPIELFARESTSCFFCFCPIKDRREQARP